MIEAINCPQYNNRFLRQFEIPIGRDKRRSGVLGKKQRRPHPHPQDSASRGYEFDKAASTFSGGCCRSSKAVADALLLKGSASGKMDTTINLAKNLTIQARRRLPGFLGGKCSTPQSAADEMESPDYHKTLQLVEDIDHLLQKEQSLSALPSSLQEVNAEYGDKVDGNMRDDAVFNLLFLHKAFYDFSMETFSRAVHIIDQFLLRVKVKPKYMACVAAAAYFIAAKECEPDESCHPTAEDLVNLTHCGGTAEDLSRMMAIIRTKLQRFLEGSSAVDYLQMLSVWATKVVEADAMRVDANHNPMTFLTSGDVRQRVVNRILYSLTSFECRLFSSGCLALACLLLECRLVEPSLDHTAVLYQLLPKLAEMCQVPWCEVVKCSEFVQRVYQQCYCATLPCSREQLFWCVSRRTRASLCIMRERGPVLSAIHEAGLEEENGQQLLDANDEGAVGLPQLLV